MSLINHIRKISIGQDFPESCIHFQVGGKVRLQGNLHEVVEIFEDSENFTKDQGTYYSIAIQNIPKEGEPLNTFVWKSFNSKMPIVIEYYIPSE